MNPGSLFAAAAFFLWGVLPVYWKLLDGAPATQLVAHRVIWSLATLVPLVWWTGTAGRIRAAAADRRVLLRQAVAAFLVSANWLAFVWSVTNDRLLEASLGYFLNPLLSVLVGVVILRERRRSSRPGGSVACCRSCWGSSSSSRSGAVISAARTPRGTRRPWRAS